MARIITHHLFLTEQQREEIQINTISVVGICSPISITDGKWEDNAQEIFCNYHLIKNETIAIHWIDNSYHLFLPKVEELKNYPVGSEFLFFTCQQEDIVHCIEIEDMKRLTETLT